MSTPTEDPSLSSGLVDYAAEHERATSESSNKEPLRSPYAPKPVNERSAFGVLARNQVEDGPLAFAPPTARAKAKFEDHSPVPAGPAAPLVAEDAFSAAECNDVHGGSTAAETTTDEHSLDPQSAADLNQSAPPSSSAHAQRRIKALTDRDLERLETSLRWLRRQETAARLTSTQTWAPSLPLSDALYAAGGHRNAAGKNGDYLRLPRSLEPDRAPVPPEGARRSFAAPFLLSIVGIGIAAIGYYVLSASTPASSPAPWARLAASAPPSAPWAQLAAIAPVASENAGATAATELAPLETTQVDGEPPLGSEAHLQQVRIALTKKLSEREAASPVQLDVAPALTMTPRRTLDPEEIKLLMEQGEQFALAGDLVTARGIFRRAAEAGSANAAIALGATYDPTVLAKLGVVGLDADIETARRWYQKAESFGSPEASRRLAILAKE